VYLERARLTTKQTLHHLTDLQTLPPMTTPPADRVDLAERLVFLDAAQSIRRDVLRGFERGSFLGKNRDKDLENAMAVIDWEVMLSKSNRWYDRLVTAMREKDRAKRENELDKIEAEQEAIRKEIRKRGERAYLLRGKDDPKLAGELVGDVLVGLLFPATRKVQERYDIGMQTERNLQLAFAIAAYHCENGRYPAKLGDLTPKYLATIPDDLFSGKALLYRRTEKGYLLYSVGVNGKDDDGRWYDDDTPGDDIRVRMPLPRLNRGR
jgi:hypothetical protein